MEYYTSKFCKNRRDDAISDLDDAIGELNRYKTRLDKKNALYRDTDIFGSDYTTDIINLIDDLKDDIEDTKEILELASFVEVN